MTVLFAVCTRAGLEAKLQGFHIIRGEILKTSTDAMIVSRAEVLQMESCPVTLKFTMVWSRFGFNKPLPANTKVCLCLRPSRSVVQVMMSFLNIEGVDVKALRAFRVLRPLRLVSGVPSESCPPQFSALSGSSQNN